MQDPRTSNGMSSYVKRNTLMSPVTEEQSYRDEVAEIKRWWTSPRFVHTCRPYTPEQVMSLRGTLTPDYPADHMSKKLWHQLHVVAAKKQFLHTFGALDPVQVIQMAEYGHFGSIYVSGWQCSSTASTTNGTSTEADFIFSCIHVSCRSGS